MMLQHKCNRLLFSIFRVRQSEWHSHCAHRLNMRLTPFILALFVAALVTWPATARPVQETEIPFEVREGLIWIAVNVRHRTEPLNFLLDSGSQVSVVDLGAARRMHLKPGRKVDVLGVNSRVTGYWPEHFAANAAGVELAENYLAVDLHELSSACRETVDGLLGADFFRRRVVQIDFSSCRIRLLPSAGGGPHTESIPLEATSKSLRVPVRVNGGRKEWMRLDTGCASPLQWVTASIPAGGERQRAVGTGDTSMLLGETMVQIGDTQFNAVPTGMQSHEFYRDEAGLLGNGLLRQFAAVTIDSAAGRVFLDKLRPVSPARQPGVGNFSKANLHFEPVIAAY